MTLTANPSIRRDKRRRRNPLPPRKDPDLVIQIEATDTALGRVTRRVARMRAGVHTSGDPTDPKVHEATVNGLRVLLCVRSHRLEIRNLEGYLAKVLPSKWQDKEPVIRLAIYAIDRVIRTEVKLAHRDELKALTALVRQHPVPLS